jgi:hypothetical protein
VVVGGGAMVSSTLMGRRRVSGRGGHIADKTASGPGGGVVTLWPEERRRRLVRGWEAVVMAAASPVWAWSCGWRCYRTLHVDLESVWGVGVDTPHGLSIVSSVGLTRLTEDNLTSVGPPSNR